MKTGLPLNHDTTWIHYVIMYVCFLLTITVYCLSLTYPSWPISNTLVECNQWFTRVCKLITQFSCLFSDLKIINHLKINTTAAVPHFMVTTSFQMELQALAIRMVQCAAHSPLMHKALGPNPTPVTGAGKILTLFLIPASSVAVFQVKRKIKIFVRNLIIRKCYCSWCPRLYLSFSPE